MHNINIYIEFDTSMLYSYTIKISGRTHFRTQVGGNCYKNDLIVSQKSGIFLAFLKLYEWKFFLASKSEILLEEPKLFS